MLMPRIIPCLLIQNKGLVKTQYFAAPKYVGDPLNAVRIFNEKKVDELMVLDIDASIKHLEPDYAMIENLAIECRMPLCYGGGIKTLTQAKQIISLGVEKIAISSAAIAHPSLLFSMADQIGRQSIVVVLDVKKNIKTKHYEVWTHNGTQKINSTLFECIHNMQVIGVGEIVINCIDNDGSMTGYDLTLVDALYDHIRVPLTVLGGAGSIEDIGKLIKNHPIIGAAAGSLFVFKGPYRAVLINYPTAGQKEALFTTYVQTEGVAQ